MPAGTTPPYRRSPIRSARKARTLTASDLGVAPEPEDIPPPGPVDVPPPSVPPAEPGSGLLDTQITEDHDLYKQVKDLLDDEYAGVIFAGPPGTSKTYYAHEVGKLLVDKDPTRLRNLQFHPSYQYEDFVEGYVPRRGGRGFRLRKKHLLEMCDIAAGLSSDKRCVIVIDELSRAEPGRVFGESLTYVEMSRRGHTFRLASGRTVSIPSNLVFLATMNVFDKGVDEIDIAFERRFARIDMPPDAGMLRKILEDNQMPESLRKQVLEFFTRLQQRVTNEYCKIGHAYFRLAQTEADLARLWEHQLKYTFQRACRLDQTTLNQITQWWKDLIPPPPPDSAGSLGSPEPGEGEPLPPAAEPTTG